MSDYPGYPPPPPPPPGGPNDPNSGYPPGYPPQGYPGYPQQGYAPPPAEKKGGAGKWILFGGLGCFFLLGVVGALIFLVYKLTSGPVEVVNEHLNQLKSGNVGGAYALCSTGFQQATPMADFQRFVDNYPVLKNAQKFESPNRKVEQGMSILNGSIVAADGSKLPAEYRLVKENNQWRILYINLGNTGTSNEQTPTSPQQEQNPQQPDTVPTYTPPQQTDDTQRPSQPQGNMRIANIQMDRQPSGNMVAIKISFDVIDFSLREANGAYEIDLVQDLETLGPDGAPVPDLSQQNFQQLNQNVQQGVNKASFSVDLTVPTTYPPGTYTVRLIINDRVTGGRAEDRATFQIP